MFANNTKISNLNTVTKERLMNSNNGFYITEIICPNYEYFSLYLLAHT